MAVKVEDVLSLSEPFFDHTHRYIYICAYVCAEFLSQATIKHAWTSIPSTGCLAQEKMLLDTDPGFVLLKFSILSRKLSSLVYFSKFQNSQLCISKSGTIILNVSVIQPLKPKCLYKNQITSAHQVWDQCLGASSTSSISRTHVTETTRGTFRTPSSVTHTTRQTADCITQRQ